MEPVNVFEYETLAQAKMNPAHWDYIQGGSDDEVTLRANRSAFERIRLRPRVLVDVSTSAFDIRTSVLGMPISMPIMVAPMAMHCLAYSHRSFDGRVAIGLVIRIRQECRVCGHSSDTFR